MFDAEIGLPVLFQSVDANLAIFGDIRMEYFGYKISFRRSNRKIFAEAQFYTKSSATERGSSCSNKRLHIQ